MREAYEHFRERDPHQIVPVELATLTSMIDLIMNAERRRECILAVDRHLGESDDALILDGERANNRALAMFHGFGCVLIVLIAAGVGRGASFERTQQHSVLISEHVDTPAQVHFEITHRYDEATGRLESADVLFAADLLTREITDRRQVEPPSFPDPGTIEERTLVETIEILQWPSVSAVSSSGPFWHPGRHGFLISLETGLDATDLILRRTLTGPESESTSTLVLPTEVDLSDLVRHEYRGGQWVPITDYLATIDFNALGATIPTVVHDGITVPGFQVTGLVPVVPEPSSLVLALLGLPLAFRRGRS